MAFRSFKEIIKEYFSFTNREKKPVFLLLSILIILVSVKYYLRFITVEPATDFSGFEKEIADFENRLPEDSISSNAESNSSRNDTVIPAAFLFNFNPNNLPDSLWVKLGVNQRVVRTIKNFEAKGGRFYKKEDLKKIYGFSEKDYERLEAHITIPEKNKTAMANPDTSHQKADRFSKKSAQPVFIFDLNIATVEDLKTIRGIGDYKANSIIKYRSLLGGYAEKEQLLEAYGIDSILFSSLKEHVEAKTKNLRTININSASETEMKHPYISKQLAVLIVNYRKMHRNFKSVEEIRKLPLVNNELYRKLAPYLSIE